MTLSCPGTGGGGGGGNREVIVSGRESTVEMLDVNRGIYMEPNFLPVVMFTDDVEPMTVPVVALMRSRVEGPLVVARPVDVILSGWESTVEMSTDDVEPLAVARPVNVDVISRAAVYPDLFSGGVIKSIDPDVGSGDPMSLKTIPDVDGDACHSVWREMVLDDVV